MPFGKVTHSQPVHVEQDHEQSLIWTENKNSTGFVFTGHSCKSKNTFNIFDSLSIFVLTTFYEFNTDFLITNVP